MGSEQPEALMESSSTNMETDEVVKGLVHSQMIVDDCNHDLGINVDVIQETDIVSGEKTDASSGEKTDASSGEKTDASSGEKTDASSVGKTDASSVGKTEASSGGKTDSSSGEKIDALSGEKIDALSEEKTDASSGEKTGESNDKKKDASSGEMTDALSAADTSSGEVDQDNRLNSRNVAWNIQKLQQCNKKKCKDSFREIREAELEGVIQWLQKINITQPSNKHHTELQCIIQSLREIQPGYIHSRFVLRDNAWESMKLIIGKLDSIQKIVKFDQVKELYEKQQEKKKRQETKKPYIPIEDPKDFTRIGDVYLVRHVQELKCVTKGEDYRVVFRHLNRSTDFVEFVNLINENVEGLTIINPWLFKFGKIFAEFSEIDQAENCKKEMNGIIFNGKPLLIRQYNDLDALDHKTSENKVAKKNTSETAPNNKSSKNKISQRNRLLRDFEKLAAGTYLSLPEVPINDGHKCSSVPSKNKNNNKKYAGNQVPPVVASAPDFTSAIYSAILKRLDISLPLVKELRVTNLGPEMTESDINEIFSKAGTVVTVTCDSEKSKAVVEMSREVDAVEAISMFHSKRYCSESLKVCMYRPQESYPQELQTVGEDLVADKSQSDSLVHAGDQDHSLAQAGDQDHSLAQAIDKDLSVTPGSQDSLVNEFQNPSSPSEPSLMDVSLSDKEPSSSLDKEPSSLSNKEPSLAKKSRSKSKKVQPSVDVFLNDPNKEPSLADILLSDPNRQLCLTDVLWSGPKKLEYLSKVKPQQLLESSGAALMQYNQSAGLMHYDLSASLMHYNQCAGLAQMKYSQLGGLVNRGQSADASTKRNLPMGDTEGCEDDNNSAQSNKKHCNPTKQQDEPPPEAVLANHIVKKLLSYFNVGYRITFRWKTSQWHPNQRPTKYFVLGLDRKFDDLGSFSGNIYINFCPDYSRKTPITDMDIFQVEKFVLRKRREWSAMLKCNRADPEILNRLPGTVMRNALYNKEFEMFLFDNASI